MVDRSGTIFRTSSVLLALLVLSSAPLIFGIQAPTSSLPLAYAAVVNHGLSTDKGCAGPDPAHPSIAHVGDTVTCDGTAAFFDSSYKLLADGTHAKGDHTFIVASNDCQNLDIGQVGFIAASSTYTAPTTLGCQGTSPVSQAAFGNPNFVLVGPETGTNAACTSVPVDTAHPFGFAYPCVLGGAGDNETAGPLDGTVPFFPGATMKLPQTSGTPILGTGAIDVQFTFIAKQPGSYNDAIAFIKESDCALSRNTGVACSEQPGLFNPTAVVTVMPVNFTVSTQSTPVGTASNPLKNPSDTVTINGVNGIEGNFNVTQATLYGPGGPYNIINPNGNGATATPKNTGVVSTYPQTITINTSGLSLSQPGTYCWNVTVTEHTGNYTTVTGGNSITDKGNATNGECFSLGTVFFTVSTTSVPLGSGAKNPTVNPSDTVTITGAPGVPGNFNVTQATLYGPGGPYNIINPNGNGATATPKNTGVVSTYPQTITINTSGLSLSQPGTYCWNVTVTEHTGNYGPSSVTDKGNATNGECFNVPPIIGTWAIATTPTPSGDLSGSSVANPTDNVTITGTINITGNWTINGSLSGPQGTFGATPVTVVGTLPLTGTLNLSSPTTITKPGTYCWSVTVTLNTGSFNSNNPQTLNDCSETFTIPTPCVVTHPTNAIDQTTVNIGPFVLTKHAEKHLFCAPDNLGDNIIHDNTLYTNILEDFTTFAVPGGSPNATPTANAPLVTTHVSFSLVTCAKDSDEPTANGPICETVPVGHTIENTTDCNQLSLSAPQRMDSVPVASLPGVVKTVESQKEIFRCVVPGVTGHVDKAVILWTIQFNNEGTGPTPPNEWMVTACTWHETASNPFNPGFGMSCQAMGPFNLVT